jgi:hypothetical protein
MNGKNEGNIKSKYNFEELENYYLDFLGSF